MRVTLFNAKQSRLLQRRRRRTGSSYKTTSAARRSHHLQAQNFNPKIKRAPPCVHYVPPQHSQHWRHRPIEWVSKHNAVVVSRCEGSPAEAQWKQKRIADRDVSRVPLPWRISLLVCSCGNYYSAPAELRNVHGVDRSSTREGLACGCRRRTRVTARACGPFLHSLGPSERAWPAGRPIVRRCRCRSGRRFVCCRLERSGSGAAGIPFESHSVLVLFPAGGKRTDETRKP